MTIHRSSKRLEPASEWVRAIVWAWLVRGRGIHDDGGWKSRRESNDACLPDVGDPKMAIASPLLYLLLVLSVF